MNAYRKAFKPRRPGRTCRCLICGQKDAGSNHVRNSYIRVGIQRDENGRESKAGDKVESRRLRRVRENRLWLSDQS